MIPTPAKQLFLLTIIPLALFIGGVWFPFLATLGLGTLILLCLAGVVDFFAAKIWCQITITPEKKLLEIPVAKQNSLNFMIENKRASVHGLLTIALPPFTDAEQITKSFTLNRDESVIVEYQLTPRRRGEYPVSEYWYRLLSPLRLWEMQKKVKSPLILRALPELSFVRDYLHLTRQKRADKLGIHRARHAGTGLEWEYLRDYTRDDDASRIEWKSSTRVNRPVIQQRQAETGSQIVFLIDCGRYMTAEYAGLTALDHSINAAIMLATLATRQGDDARVITFSDRIRGDFKLRAGRGSTARLISHLAPIHPDFVESNYQGAFEYLNKNLNRRSLVIFMTDILDDLNYSLFSTQLHWLKRRHLPLFIFLRDTNLHEELQKEREDTVEILRNIAARELILQRNKTIKLLQLNGADTLDVPPTELTADLLDRYLQIKAKHRL